MRALDRIAASVAVALLSGCSGTGPGDNDGPVFAALPIAAERIACILPLGHMALPGDLLGAHTSRWDVRERGPCGPPEAFSGSPVEVLAAASGTIVTAGAGSVLIAVSQDLEYSYRGVVLDGFITEGANVSAGQRLGVLANPDSGLAFGIIDYERVNAWLSEARYPDPYRHARHPVDWYEGALRDAISTRSAPTVSASQLVWDAAGTAAGNWFREDVPLTGQATSVAWWDRHLSFHGMGSSRRIGMGAALDQSGGCVCAPAAGSPAFTDVTPGSGPVAYAVRTVDEAGVISNDVRGTLLVELPAAARMRVEWFAGSTTPTGFTDAAAIYIR